VGVLGAEGASSGSGVSSAEWKGKLWSGNRKESWRLLGVPAGEFVVNALRDGVSDWVVSVGRAPGGPSDGSQLRV
jgi:hypothetical protein